MPKKPPPPEPQSCATCRFFLANSSDEYGYCRRYPPTPAIRDDAQATLWPVLSSSDLCGEFQRKLNS